MKMLVTILAVCFISQTLATNVALHEEDAPDAGSKSTDSQGPQQERFFDLFADMDFSDYDIDNPSDKILADSEVAQCLMEQHNFYREAVGLEPLTWNTHLADLAWETSQMFRDTECKDYHRYAFNQENWIGENLWSIKSMPYFFDEGRDMCEQAKNGVDEWYKEIRYYVYPLGNLPFHKCLPMDDFEKYGHFIQMMWRHGRELGCSYAYCMNYEDLFPMPKIIVNCYYDTPILQGSMVFDTETAQKLNEWDYNEKYGGLANCTVED